MSCLLICCLGHQGKPQMAHRNAICIINEESVSYTGQVAQHNCAHPCTRPCCRVAQGWSDCEPLQTLTPVHLIRLPEVIHMLHVVAHDPCAETAKSPAITLLMWGRQTTARGRAGTCGVPSSHHQHASSASNAWVAHQIITVERGNPQTPLLRLLLLLSHSASLFAASLPKTHTATHHQAALIALKPSYRRVINNAAAQAG